MTEYARYCIEVKEGGRRVKVKAENVSGKTIAEPEGTRQLDLISTQISQLVDKVRRDAASMAEMETLGEGLFAALFPPEIASHFRSLLGECEDSGLRLELDLDESALPQVAALPWEFLRAPQSAGWAADNLGTHPKVVLSRRRALWKAAPPAQLSEPLRIQLVVSAPSDLGEVVYEEVETALQNLAHQHPKQIAPPPKTLLNPDKTDIERTLESVEPHIWHFIGHGRLRKARNVEFGELALVGSSGISEWLSDEEIGEIFQGHPPKVVLLQACQSGAEGSAGALVGVASQVVQRNVPVVIGMQYPISNSAAIAFAEEFYRRLGEFKPVDEAVQNSRRLLKNKFRTTRDFAAPVLFLRVKDGQLFAPPKSQEHKPFVEAEQKPDLTIQPFPAWFSADLPHPIAWACENFNTTQSEKDRFAALDRLIINFVKYLTAIALSQYWQDNPNRERLLEWLSQLSESRLMTTWVILDRVCQHYGESPSTSDLHHVLFAPYLEPHSDESQTALAYHAINKMLPRGQRMRGESITLHSFFDALLALREPNWEPSPPEIDENLRAVLLPVLRTAMEELINLFRSILKYPLYYIENVVRSGTDWVYTLTTFPGAEGKPESAGSYLEVGAKSPSYPQGYLYLCLPEKLPVLNLHPLLIEHWLELYFLEQGAPKGSIWYRHCASSKRYQPPDCFHLLSATWANPEKAAADQNDPVDQLNQAREEQVQADREDRIDLMPLNILMTYLSDDARAAMEIGLGEALRIGQFWLGVEFLLTGLSKLEGGPLVDLCAMIGIDPGELRGVLRGLVKITCKDWRQQRDVQALGAAALPTLQVADPKSLANQYNAGTIPPVVITPRLVTILRQAVQWAGENKVGSDHLLLAILHNPHNPAVNMIFGLMAQQGLDPRQFIKELEWQAEVGDKTDEPGGQLDVAPPPPEAAQGLPRGQAAPVKGLLGQLGRDLTALAIKGKLHPAIGASAKNAMRQIGQVLLQSQANNPILLGDPGVGKTAIVEGFAWRLAVEADIVPQLAGKRMVELAPAALLAGTEYRGKLEERLQKVLAEVRQAQGQTVVFIDEIHTILGGGAEGGLGSIAQAFKPALARGEFPCIGATTVAEYRRYIEKDPALARRFTPVWIEEPSTEEAIEIAVRVAQDSLAKHHSVAYSPEAVEEAVRLSQRYLPAERLPSKAIKLLDQAGSRVVLRSPGALPGKLGVSLRGDKGQELPAESKIVTAEIIRTIVAEQTGIPVEQLSKSDKMRLLALEAELKQRVIGQDEAVAAVTRVVKRARAGMADPRRPLGVFLFAGPTGVGKTELALALAAALFSDEKALLRLDMSEYMEKHTVSRLLGSPPGYVGYEDEGQLTSFLRRRPYSVVLFDEMEKAHADIQHLFLQLFDAGRLTDAHGRLADGRNAIFIMTTNLDSAGIQQKFTAEFRNRIDQVLVFNALTAEMLVSIFDKLFARAAGRFAEQGIQIEITEEFKQAFCAAHTDTTQGARPLERAIANEITDPLSDKLLAGELEPGMKVAFSSRVPKISGKQRPKSPAEPPRQSPELNPPLPDMHRPPADDRDGITARNLEKFDAAWASMLERLRPLELTIEFSDDARAYLCDPLWNENRTLEQALADLVEQPLRKKAQDKETKPGSRVQVGKYAANLVFNILEEGAA
jgi:ATP-dependent Clp protease ATP-binding subunit ClpC